MTVRPIIEAPADVRPSAKIARVAQLLDCDERDVRRMLQTGELEGHGKGIRGKRIYLDSVKAYQEARAITPEEPRRKIRAQRAAISRAAQAAAEAALRKSGILR